MTTLSCKVTSVEAITDTVYRVRIVPDAAFSFRAGQYLMVVMDERDKRPFSMSATNVRSQWLRRQMKKGLSSCILALLKYRAAYWRF